MKVDKAFEKYKGSKTLGGLKGPEMPLASKIEEKSQSIYMLLRALM